jgi:hypothetical protein
MLRERLENRASKAKRGTAEVDDEFLQTIESWRKELAENLALRNKKLSQRELTVVMPDGTRVAVQEGTPQGGPLSPLLSNIVLNELDGELARSTHH